MKKQATGIDLIIFDLDGTLTDSIPPAITAIQEMLRELGLPHKTAEEMKPHVGYGEIPLLTGAIGSSDPALLKKAFEIYERNYLARGIRTIPLYPHVREFLEAFRDKPKVIISNKKYDFIMEILKNHGLTGYFEEVYGGDTSPCLKPDPCLINDIVAKRKIDKRKVLLVGDMTVDIETGKNAGVLTCAVSYGFDGRSKLEMLKPDIIVDDLMELTDLIK